MVTSKSNTALTDKSFTFSSATAQRYLMRQYVSAQIGVFDFNGNTVSGVVRCVVNSVTNTTCKLSFYLGLYHTDTTITDLLALADYDVNTWTATASTKVFSGVSLPNVQSRNNDRIILEWGMGRTGTASGSRTYTERFGDPSATGDHNLTSGQTTDLDPWFEFTGTIPAASPDPVGHALVIGQATKRAAFR